MWIYHTVELRHMRVLEGVLVITDRVRGSTLLKPYCHTASEQTYILYVLSFLKAQFSLSTLKHIVVFFTFI